MKCAWKSPWSRTRFAWDSTTILFRCSPPCRVCMTNWSIPCARSTKLIWRTPKFPICSSFGSWIGGDRDGNPFVTPGSTREALQRARNVIIGHYIAELERATDQLSASVRQVAVSDAVRARLADYSTQMGDEYARQSRISSSELYRRLLNLMVVRLRHSREEIGDTKAYPSAGEFESDLSADPRKPGGEPRAAAGRTGDGSAAAPGAYFRISSFDPRHPPARARACPGAGRD